MLIHGHLMGVSNVIGFNIHYHTWLVVEYTISLIEYNAGIIQMLSLYPILKTHDI